MLAGPEIEGPSSAVAINSSGWIVGDYTLNGKIHRAFLWREVSGWTDLEALLPANSPWIVQSVAGLNAQGNIVGQGYNHTSTSQNTTRAVILTPYPVSPTEPEPIN